MSKSFRELVESALLEQQLDEGWLANKLKGKIPDALTKNRYINSSVNDHEDKVNDLQHDALYGKMDSKTAVKIAHNTLNNTNNLHPTHKENAIRILQKHGSKKEVHAAIHGLLDGKNGKEYAHIAADVTDGNDHELNNKILNKGDMYSARDITRKVVKTGNVESASKLLDHPKVDVHEMENHTDKDVHEKLSSKHDATGLLYKHKSLSHRTMSNLANHAINRYRNRSTGTGNARDILEHPSVSSHHIDMIAKNTTSEHGSHESIIRHEKTSNETLQHISKNARYSNHREDATIELAKRKVSGMSKNDALAHVTSGNANEHELHQIAKLHPSLNQDILKQPNSRRAAHHIANSSSSTPTDLQAAHDSHPMDFHLRAAIKEHSNGETVKFKT